MKGDILIIKEHHRKAGQEIYDLCSKEIEQSKGVFFMTVSGESGAGKSEIAASVAEYFNKNGIKSYVFQQDDFFIYPPKTNAARREQDISWVGTNEVKLDLLEEIIKAIRNGVMQIDKPLVIFDDDKITEETIDLSDVKLVIIEGTYTTMLSGADLHVFIDRNIYDTRESRKERGREKQDEFLERILMIEHRIISSHKELAELVVNKDYSVTKIK
jgi:uridine kinase